MRYKSDLREEQWDKIKKYFDKKSNMGRPREWTNKDIVDAIMYVVKTGCQWSMLPNDLPPRSTVFDHYRNWSRDGTWEKVLDELVEISRKSKGKKATPSLAIIDAQSSKTTTKKEDRWRKKK